MAARAENGRRLRIAQVVTRMDVGGVPEHVLTLARGLAASHEVTVVCGSIDTRNAAALAEAGVGVEHVDFRRLLHPAGDVRAFAGCLRLFRDRRFDVVHTHMSKAALVGTIAARLARVPAIVNTAHNLGFLALRRKLLRGLFWAYDRALFSLAIDRVITVSERVRCGAVDGRLFPADRTVAIHNGLAITGFEGRSSEANRLRSEFGIASEAPLLLSVARLVWFKGLDSLVAALPAVIARHPATRLVVVGAGPLLTELEAQAAALGVREAIVFAGERTDVPDCLAACDLFVLPSVSEGLPISILEAMAAGRAVVATEVGGVPELVTEGETGFVVPPRDPGALAAALLRLLDDPDLRARMGEAGRERVRTAFSPETMVARTLALYEEVLRERGRR